MCVHIVSVHCRSPLSTPLSCAEIMTTMLSALLQGVRRNLLVAAQLSLFFAPRSTRLSEVSLISIPLLRFRADII